MMLVELEGGPLGPDELRVEFAGEWYSPATDEQFVIGREAVSYTHLTLPTNREV